MTQLKATNIYYIKLGRAGDWEKQSIQNGILRFGYREAPHEMCILRDWHGVWNAMKIIRNDDGVARRDVNQIRAFYEADENTIFITFFGGMLYWCRPSGPVELLPDGNHTRKTVSGWKNTTLSGVPLSTDRLSGHLLKTQMFRGTICDVKAADYLLRKLNDSLLPEVVAAESAERELLAAIVGLMRLLTWQDFELLVDLIFSSSGWRRLGQVGRTQKSVDLELILPTTGERAFVQVKSNTNAAGLKDYYTRLVSSEAYDRMFFIWHSGDLEEHDQSSEVILLGPQKLSRIVLDTGLVSWLREKVS